MPNEDAPPPAQPAGAPSRLVLVVDDSEDNRLAYAEYLEYVGYRVEQAADGQQAVASTQRLEPDAVVMDMSLPVMDGWEATRRIKADPRTRHIPVIALSGFGPGDLAHDVRESGADAFLTKPCLPERLVETIEDLLRAEKTELHRADHDAGR
jgi:CheY-like chemotaxis protein